MSVLASAPRGTGQTLPLRKFFPPAERTVPKMLLRQAERYAQRRLVSIGGVTLTYAETCAAAARYAAALAASGTKAGDRVAIMCGNRAEILFLRSWAAPGSALSLFPSIPLRAAHSSNTFSAIAARDFLSSSAG